MSVGSSTRAEVADYLQRMQPLIDLWSHVTRQAVSEMTTMPLRRMMGAHIEHLQSLYCGARELTVPPLCRRAHDAFLAAIGASIDAYLATAESRHDEQAHEIFLSAMHAYHDWRAEVAELMPTDLN